MSEIIRINGQHQEVSPQDGACFSLDELQSIVGGMIELVALNDTETMVVNEEGKLLNMPYNFEATRIFKNNYPDIEEFIVGDVLICNNEQIK